MKPNKNKLTIRLELRLLKLKPMLKTSLEIQFFLKNGFFRLSIICILHICSLIIWLCYVAPRFRIACTRFGTSLLWYQTHTATLNNNNNKIRESIRRGQMKGRVKGPRSLARVVRHFRTLSKVTYLHKLSLNNVFQICGLKNWPFCHQFFWYTIFAKLQK